MILSVVSLNVHYSNTNAENNTIENCNSLEGCADQDSLKTFSAMDSGKSHGDAGGV